MPTNPLVIVLREAQMPGEVAPPAALIEVLAGVENPIAALSDPDQANGLFEALDNEFGFMTVPRENSLQPYEQSRWASLLRWLIRELVDWRQAEDPLNRKLVAIFVVAQASDREDQLWSLLPSEIGKNADLIRHLKSLVGSFAATFNARSGMPVPIWEREAIEKYKAADAAGDWIGTGRGLSLFENQIFPSTVQTQSARCLCRCDIDHLVNALANLRQTAVAMQIAGALPIDQQLRLAARSDNPYVQFGCLLQMLSRGHIGSLSLGEQQLLTALLLKVAPDESRWLAWMHVFNSYPIRYPTLQVPLGHALADVPEPAVEAYVKTIILRPMPAKPNGERRAVAECLRAFGGKAAPSRRALLWTRAHERWLMWRFDQANPDKHLLAISWSDLDYAVVAFASECMTDADRTNEMNAIRDELQILEDQWHGSIIDIVTAWNRLLSKFQPYAHASRAIESGEDWLTEKKIYWPFDPSKEQYLTMKYRVG